MKHDGLHQAAEYTSRRRRRKRWKKVVACLAAVVVFCTTYALILPAITLEKLCEIPEHTHTDTCYTQVTSVEKRAPVCSRESLELHQHTDSCRDGDGHLICGCADFVVHTHDSACYDESAVLWCPLPEIKAHTHNESCWAVPETEPPHAHTDECYAWEQGETLTCTEEEQEGHTHTNHCYEQIHGDLICEEPTDTEAGERELICEKEELLLHKHDSDCFDKDGNLICEEIQVLEHRHTNACFETIEEPVDTEALTCEIPEGEGSHIHSVEAGCFDENGELVCQMEESEGHAHTALCYGTWELTCEMTEHTHSNACISAPEDPQHHVHSEACCDKNGNLVCQLTDVSGETEPAFLPLAGDDALLRQMAVEKTEVIAAIHKDAVPPETAARLPAGAGTADTAEAVLTAQNQDSIHYTITGTINTYTDVPYLDGRIRFEFVLPLTQEQAVFDLDAMSWSDSTEGYAPVLTTENRTFGGKEISCQVLTLWLHLTPGETQDRGIPGEFSVISAVSVENMAHKDSVSLQISAAMEFSVWEGICPVHEIEEKRTITTQAVTVLDPAMMADYQFFLVELEALEAIAPWNDAATAQAEDLMQQILTAYEAGLLSEEEFPELQDRLVLLLYGDVNALAEPALGTNWMALRDSGWFSAYSGSAISRVSQSAVRYAAARGAMLPNEGGTAPSDVQIVQRGGSSTSDDGRVTVSKTISGTELENVFDITLQVQTGEKIAAQYEEPDMAVVIVMDISNTMKDDFGNTTRYAAAMDAAEKFLDEFSENNAMGISKVGYVAFNTNAHQIFGLQPCTSMEQANALKNTMRTQTGAIIHQSGYASSHSRFTNVEAGLKMASDMLSGVSNKNKYIIFLSDGFPTTYISSGYNGYDPYTGSGTVGNDGVFHDDVLNQYCTYGTSYSDKAAIRARSMAASIKASGTTIFSIGVDVGGQTIRHYVESSEKSNGFSVVDRTGTTYEIGDASSAEAYKNWLRNSIGSGYYYDSTDSAGLSSAYAHIFAEIKHLVGIGSQADWVANDPLPSITGEPDAVEFIGFFDKTPTLVSGDLVGSYTPGGENTAAFRRDNNAIKWDLKKSGYVSTTEGGTTTYLYQLCYRVRLQNENGIFSEGSSYPTNDTTTLQYRYFESMDGTIQVSDLKTVEFPIPAVKGYLAEWMFQKVDSDGRALEGAEFTLYHDDKNCPVCRGDGTSVAVSVFNAKSDGTGTVTFRNIPSGHQYLLEETEVPAGYSAIGDSYGVEVAYDKLTVTVTAYDGSDGVWNGEIVNNVYYELPSTGGAGTYLYTTGGTLLTFAAVILLYIHKRRGKEAPTSS